MGAQALAAACMLAAVLTVRSAVAEDVDAPSAAGAAAMDAAEEVVQDVQGPAAAAEAGTAAGPDGGATAADVAPSAPPGAQALWRQARALDEAGDLAGARARYEQAIAAQPSARFAARAIARVRAIDALLALNDPAAAALRDVQARYLQLGSDAALAEAERLLRDAASDAARGRLELWIAEEHESKGRHSEAVPRYVRVLTNPEAVRDDVVRAGVQGARIASTVAEVRAVRGAVRAALAREGIPRAPLLTALDDLQDTQLRRVARPASVASVVALLAVFLARRGWRRLGGVRVSILALLVYAAVGGAVLSERWEHDHGLPFALVGLSLIAVHILTVGAAPGRGWPRAALLVLSVLATVGAMYIVLDMFGESALIGL